MDSELVAADGHRLYAYRAAPAGKPRGAVVVIQEIFGVNHHIRAVTDSFARAGYVAIAPALFDRIERDVQLGYDTSTIARGRALKAKASIDDALADTTAAIAEVAGAGKVGIVGFCWGGFVTWMAAGKLAGLACAITYYGGGVLDHADDAPRVPVLGHFGEHDKGIPASGVHALAARYPEHEFHLYDADHGFHCDERGSYDAAAAGLAGERTLAFLRHHVG